MGSCVYLRHLSTVRVRSTYRPRVDRVSVDSADGCHEDTWKNDQMSSTKIPIGLLDSVLRVRYMYLCLKKVVALHRGEL